MAGLRVHLLGASGLHMPSTDQSSTGKRLSGLFDLLPGCPTHEKSVGQDGLDSGASNSRSSGMLFLCRLGVGHTSETSARPDPIYCQQSHIGSRNTPDTKTVAHRVRSTQYHSCGVSHENAAQMHVALPKIRISLCQGSGPLRPATATSIRPGESRKASYGRRT